MDNIQRKCCHDYLQHKYLIILTTFIPLHLYCLYGSSNDSTQEMSSSGDNRLVSVMAWQLRLRAQVCKQCCLTLKKQNITLLYYDAQTNK
jgi:hypothetical protein